MAADGTRRRAVLTAVLALALAACAASAAGIVRSKPVAVSRCAGRNAEVEQAVDGSRVYEAWIGCNGIGFARSVDGGRSFGRSLTVPGSGGPGSRFRGWDPALTVAPDGTVYVAYMVDSLVQSKSGGTVRQMAPAVAVSLDHGRSFARSTILPVPRSNDYPAGNWGDRDFVAVGPDGTIYVTWDYGPRADEVRIFCPKTGSCAFTAGDFNAVLQKSTDGGRTWSQPTSISPGFPLGGVYSAPIVAEPNGTLDVLYWQHPTDPKTFAVSPGYEYFTRSTDGGATWSTPVEIDPAAGTISLEEWWIDGSLAVDPAGNLYAAWDTQGSRDTAWLAWSSDGGATWSAPLKVHSSHGENLVEVAAAGRNDVYVGWQTLVPRKGYATVLRRLAVGKGWTSNAVRLSSSYGKAKIWPGDTFGLSTTSGGGAIVSWGSATGRSKFSAIYAARASLPSHPG